MNKENKKNNMKKISAIIGTLVIVAVLVFLGRSIVFGKNNPDGKPSPVVVLDNRYDFTARNSQAARVSDTVTLRFTGAHKEEEVLIRGSLAKARNNKAFLLFDINIVNETDHVLYLNPLDLVRLVVDEETFIAPQVHQGSLEVRPQSTKTSNVGFVVADSDKNFTLQVGELDGQKQTFDVTVK